MHCAILLSFALVSFGQKFSLSLDVDTQNHNPVRLTNGQQVSIKAILRPGDEYAYNINHPKLSIRSFRIRTISSDDIFNISQPSARSSFHRQIVNHGGRRTPKWTWIGKFRLLVPEQFNQKNLNLGLEIVPSDDKGVAGSNLTIWSDHVLVVSRNEKEQTSKAKAVETNEQKDVVTEKQHDASSSQIKAPVENTHEVFVFNLEANSRQRNQLNSDEKRPKRSSNSRRDASRKRPIETNVATVTDTRLARRFHMMATVKLLFGLLMAFLVFQAGALLGDTATLLSSNNNFAVDSIQPKEISQYPPQSSSVTVKLPYHTLPELERFFYDNWEAMDRLSMQMQLPITPLLYKSTLTLRRGKVLEDYKVRIVAFREIDYRFADTVADVFAERLNDEDLIEVPVGESFAMEIELPDVFTKVGAKFMQDHTLEFLVVFQDKEANDE